MLKTPGAVLHDCAALCIALGSDGLRGELTLLRAARARGLTTVPGLGMLLHQARPAFQAWYGVMLQVTPELRRRMEASL